MTRRALLLSVVIGGCASPRPAAVQPEPAVVANPGTVYSRMPTELEAFRLTERSSVTGYPTDSVFRFRDGSQTILTVIIYNVTDDVKVDADSQKWTAREGEKFWLVQSIRRDRGQLSDFVRAINDTTRVPTTRGRILEHFSGSPTRYPNGNVTVEMQFLYLIDGKFLKVRATIPEPGWQQSRVPVFACELAHRVAGDASAGAKPRSRADCLASPP